MKETRYFRKNYKVDKDNVQILYVRSDIGKIIHRNASTGLLKVVGIEINENSFDVGLIVERAENG